MKEQDWMWVDMRWREPGWREAFRLRLSGWLPKDWAKNGLEHEVMVQSLQEGHTVLSLTNKGRLLTDISPTETSNECMQFMSFVLFNFAFERQWFFALPQVGDLSLSTHEKFQSEYSSKLFTHYCDTLHANETIQSA